MSRDDNNDRATTTAMQHAIQRFLQAAGLDTTDPDLASTPARVARLWREEFLSGYDMDPAEILANPVIGEADPSAIVLTDLSFHSMCPHHLLPYQGRAHVAYIPEGRLLGFGQIARLVACFTQRLTLQERATHEIAEALRTLLPARGAGCVLHARQLCLGIPGDRHQENGVVTSAFVGELQRRPELQQRLLAASAR